MDTSHGELGGGRTRPQVDCGPVWADGSRRSAGFGQLRDRQRGVRQLARRIERHAQHAQQLFDELITGRVIDEFGIRQRARANRGSALRNPPEATPARMSRSRRGATPPSDPI